MGKDVPSENWSEMIFGTVGDGHEATAVFGRSEKDGQTLIADGFAESKTQFDQNHDHFFGDGTGTDRGAYTGPGTEVPKS
jgi:hypothetical protein